MATFRNVLMLLAAVLVTGEAMATDGSEPGRQSAAIAPVQVAPALDSKTRSLKPEKEKQIPALSLTGLDGKKHTLADWKGKVVVLNFWATWCSPCLYEIHDFVAYQEQYQARGLQIIGVGLDEEGKLRNVQRTLGMNYPVLVADPEKNSGLMTQWGNSSGVVPYTVVIDREGRVAYSRRGLMGQDEFEEYILPLLDKEKIKV